MHPRTRRLSRTLATATALALLAAPGTAVAVPDPAPVPPAAPGDAPRGGADAADTSGTAAGRVSPGAVDPADKIAPAAAKAFATRGTTDFWLRFDDAPDLSAAAGITSWAERGQYVYDTLTAAAESAQSRTIAALERSGTEYTSYWATNAILVEDGSLDQAVELAGAPEVAEVRATTQHAVEEPETTQAATTAAAGTPTYGIRAINADDMWNQGFTGEGIVVAGLDTGVSRSHPALSAQYRGATTTSNYNWFDAAHVGATTPRDDHGHGTHTMGTMVGTGNGTTSIGVAPGARWIAANGCADACLDSWLVAAGEWMLAPTRADGSAADPSKRPHIVNNSWGMSRTNDPFMEDVITAWEASGIFSTWSNGNDGEWGCESSGSPGARQASYSVGAFSSAGSIAAFSSRGPGQGGAVKPDIAAPGVDVLSAVPGNGYERWSGTSMAAPHVSGAVALLWDAVPALVGDVPRTRAILDGAAHDVNNTACGGTADDNNVWGEGKLDVLAAYELAQEESFTDTPAPTVSGDAYEVGTPLTATVGTWTPAATLSYQWRRDLDPADGRPGAMISGATGATYTPKGRDAGAALSVTVVGTADGYIPTAVTSAPTPVVQKTAIKAAAPTISGTVRVGSTLRALSGTWTSGTRFTYQWKVNGTAISGATKFTFTPRAADRGKQLTVTITGSRRGYDGAARTSAAKTVGYGVFTQARPRLVGSPAPGGTVTVSAPPSSPSAATTTYQWRVDGRAISGATGSSYRIPSTWKGRTLSVSVTRKRTSYTTKTVTSTQRAIGTRFSSVPTPRITGTARVGSTVRVTAGTWRPGAYVTYQWYSNGVPIAGATGTTYRIAGAYVGKRLSVVVTGRKSGYATTDKSSTSVPVYQPADTVPADEWWYVGGYGVPAATYVAKNTKDCVWERLNDADVVLGADWGSGQRVATAKSTDGSFRSMDCGTWVRHYPGMVTPRNTTPKDGVYVLGDQLERGTYVTPGPAAAGETCYYAFIKEFTGLANRSNLAGHRMVDEATTITMPSTAKGFETAGCYWYRVS
ncbi:S8 family serine peptidase [Promicromonospora sp. NPDC052451]|uniref:S8 family serine peptidase n=1 Tax=Promicromonospora sp. NPDC052451 TaxID=3364407 RepID=UPI0037CB5EC2